MSENDNKNSLNSLEEFDKSIEKEELRSFDKKEGGNPLNSLEDLNKSIKPESLRKFNEANGIKEKAEVVKEEAKEQVKEQVKKEVKSAVKKKLLLLLKPLIVPGLYALAGLVIIVVLFVVALIIAQAMFGTKGREAEEQQTAMMITQLNQNTSLFTGYASDIPLGAPITGHVAMFGDGAGTSFYSHMYQRKGYKAIALDIHEFGSEGSSNPTEKAARNMMEAVSKFLKDGSGGFTDLSKNSGISTVTFSNLNAVEGAKSDRTEFLKGLIEKYGSIWDFEYYLTSFQDDKSLSGYKDCRTYRVHSRVPIFSTLSGKVVYADDTNGGSGGAITIKGKDYAIGLLHNSKVMVTKGQDVGAGQLVAILGNRGQSCGAHLHYEIAKKGSTSGYILGYGATGYQAATVGEHIELMSQGKLLKKGRYGYFNHVGTNMGLMMGANSGEGNLTFDYDMGDSDTGFVEGDERKVYENEINKYGIAPGSMSPEGGTYKLGFKRYIKQSGGVYTTKTAVDYYTKLYTDAGFSRALPFTIIHREGPLNRTGPEEVVSESQIYYISGDGGAGPVQNQHPTSIWKGTMVNNDSIANAYKKGNPAYCNFYAPLRTTPKISTMEGAKARGCDFTSDLRMNPNYQYDVSFNLTVGSKMPICYRRAQAEPGMPQVIKTQKPGDFELELCTAIAYNGLTPYKQKHFSSHIIPILEDVKNGTKTNLNRCKAANLDGYGTGCKYAYNFIVNYMAVKNGETNFFNLKRTE